MLSEVGHVKSMTYGKMNDRGSGTGVVMALVGMLIRTAWPMTEPGQPQPQSLDGCHTKPGMRGTLPRNWGKRESKTWGSIG
jgi:hypothetical protein